MPENNALRLYPLPSREISAGGIYEDLELPPADRRDPSRPYVLINMVSSLDGRTTLGGKAARIGSETDREVMRNLRAKADAVMIGANTLRAEKLSLGLDETTGGSQPLGVVLTNTGDVPLERNLIQHESQKVLVLVPDNHPSASVSRLRCQAEVLRAPATPDGSVDIGRALKILKEQCGVDVLLSEGGPVLNHALISRNLADELFLTIAPKLLGGSVEETLPMLVGRPLPPAAPRPALLSLHLADGDLFVRYSLPNDLQ